MNSGVVRRWKIKRESEGSTKEYVSVNFSMKVVWSKIGKALWKESNASLIKARAWDFGGRGLKILRENTSFKTVCVQSGVEGWWPFVER